MQRFIQAIIIIFILKLECSTDDNVKKLPFKKRKYEEDICNESSILYRILTTEISKNVQEKKQIKNKDDVTNIIETVATTIIDLNENKKFSYINLILNEMIINDIEIFANQNKKKYIFLDFKNINDEISILIYNIIEHNITYIENILNLPSFSISDTDLKIKPYVQLIIEIKNFVPKKGQSEKSNSIKEVVTEPIRNLLKKINLLEIKDKKNQMQVELSDMFSEKDFISSKTNLEKLIKSHESYLFYCLISGLKQTLFCLSMRGEFKNLQSDANKIKFNNYLLELEKKIDKHIEYFEIEVKKV